MKNFYTLLFVLSSFVSFCDSSARASDVLPLEDALRATYTACVGIDENLHELKVLAGINTAVSSVGTAAGVGAVAVGFAKADLDKKIEESYEELRSFAFLYQGEPPTSEEKAKWYEEVCAGIDAIDWNNAKQDIEQANKARMAQVEERKLEEENWKKKYNEDVNKSKKLGNWRTGLLATNAATNVAGVALAVSTIKKDDIQAQVDACVSAVSALNLSIMQSIVNGEDVSEARNIYRACAEYEFVDVTPIVKRGTGSAISSGVGAAAGAAGAVVSGVANTDKIRENDTWAGKNKEKNLNTAANVLAIGATAASLTSTVFNATQIAAIKKVAAVSEKCTSVLK